jgi:hypothetical protein
MSEGNPLSPKKLPKEDQEAYRNVLRLRKQHEPIVALPGSEQARKNKLWRDFAVAFYAGQDVDFTRFAENPETFDASKFRMKAVVAGTARIHDPEIGYVQRGSFEPNLFAKNSLYIDAPFAYALSYLREPEQGETEPEWETIGVVSFTPDLEKRVLVIDQIQGGDTERKRASKKARRVRMKFAGQEPAYMLLSLVEELARKTGMRGIALRKAEHSKWDTVRRARAGGKKTLYDKLGKAAGMRGFASREYFLVPLDK